MRHRVSGRKLGRDTKHRIALFKNLARGLVLHGTVTTTEAKGKELKRVADKLVSKAKTNTIETRRVLHRYFGKRDVVNTLVEQVAPVFADRQSGFTRIERSGVRAGDNTQMVTISWVNKPETVGALTNPQPSKRTSAKKAVTAEKTAPAKPSKAVVEKKSAAKKPTTKKTK